METDGPLRRETESESERKHAAVVVQAGADASSPPDASALKSAGNESSDPCAATGKSEPSYATNAKRGRSRGGKRGRGGNSGKRGQGRKKNGPGSGGSKHGLPGGGSQDSGDGRESDGVGADGPASGLAKGRIPEGRSGSGSKQRDEVGSGSGRAWGDGVGSGGGSGGGGAAFGPGGTGPGRGRGGRRHEKWSGRKRFIVWCSIGLAGVIVLGASSFTLVWNHLNGNIKTEWADLKPSAMNGKQDVLFIGSDSRAGANQALGGGAVVGARSDTTMVFDSPADRRKGTEVSIPRDSMVQIPDCTSADGQTVSSTFGMFNSAFTSGGAPCTVRTVESLTGLPLTHYIVVDFEGVVGVVNALGGVKVCVTQALKDRDSGLNLPAGTTTLNGQQALAFVRVRHAVGDGSDLERIQRQQYFIDQLSSQVRAAGLLSDPVKLYKVLNAATSAIQADPGLGTVSELYGLAQTLNSIPSGKMTYVTVPSKPFPDNPDRVVWNEPAATKLWDSLINESDSTTAASGSAALGLRSGIGGNDVAGWGLGSPRLGNPAVGGSATSGSGVVGSGLGGVVADGSAPLDPSARAAVPTPGGAQQPGALRSGLPSRPVYGPMPTTMPMSALGTTFGPDYTPIRVGQAMSDIEAFLGDAPGSASDATSAATMADAAGPPAPRTTGPLLAEDEVRAAESLGAFESLMRLALMADNSSDAANALGRLGASGPSGASDTPSDSSIGSAAGTTRPGGVDTCPVT